MDPVRRDEVLALVAYEWVRERRLARIIALKAPRRALADVSVPGRLVVEHDGYRAEAPIGAALRRELLADLGVVPPPLAARRTLV